MFFECDRDCERDDPLSVPDRVLRHPRLALPHAEHQVRQRAVALARVLKVEHRRHHVWIELKMWGKVNFCSNSNIT